ncbi:MAG: sigma-70 family RNA polymerase sigma factor, partial [Candidatus Woesearchaeota archaeon]
MTESQFNNNIVVGCNDLIYGLCSKFHIRGYDIDDLYQIVILELWENKDKYNPQYNITTWVHTIVKRKLIALLRKQSTIKRGKNEENLSLNIEIGNEENTSLCDMI